MSLEPGIERTDEFTAEGALLTDVRGTLPVKVLSTPGMIAMMERCASILSWDNLEEGKATVGFEVCVKHVAPPPRAPAARSRRRCARSTTAASSASTSRCATASAQSAWARTSAA